MWDMSIWSLSSRADDVANGDAVDRGAELTDDDGCGFRLSTKGGVEMGLTGDIGSPPGGGELAMPDVFGVYPGLCMLRKTWERGFGGQKE